MYERIPLLEKHPLVLDYWYQNFGFGTGTNGCFIQKILHTSQRSSHDFSRVDHLNFFLFEEPTGPGAHLKFSFLLVRNNFRAGASLVGTVKAAGGGGGEEEEEEGRARALIFID